MKKKKKRNRAREREGSLALRKRKRGINKAIASRREGGVETARGEGRGGILGGVRALKKPYFFK